MSGKIKFLYDEHLDNPSTTVRIYNTKGSQDLILKAFYQDDFHMSITNQWASGDSTIFKQLVDSAASVITGRTGKLVNTGLRKLMDYATGDMKEGDAGYKFKQGVESVLSGGAKLQNSSFFTADDFYKTFKGTTVTFPLNVNLTLVSDEIYPKEDIYDRLKKLINVTVGDYTTTGFGFIGIQGAPNEFESGDFNVSRDSILKGTLRVVYGDPNEGGFTLDNMLVANLHCTFSKTKVQVYDNIWRPLYVDVQIMLEPGKKFTRDEVFKNIGLNRLPNNRNPNFKFNNGRGSKEDTEVSISRSRELEIIQNNKNSKVVKNSFNRDFAGVLPDIDFTTEDGVLIINFSGSKDSLKDILDSLNLDDYPGISEISIQTL